MQTRIIVKKLNSNYDQYMLVLCSIEQVMLRNNVLKLRCTINFI